jgi:hypothetical protein
MTAPDVPAVDIDPGFPLRAHLLVTKWGGENAVYHGFGSGNLLDPKGPQGFDYAFECNVPFVNNDVPEEAYQARWRRPYYELDLLVSVAGTTHLGTCTLRLALKQVPFEADDTAKISHRVPTSLAFVWRDPGFAYEPAVADYSVHFHVLDGQRVQDISGDHGWGTANISTPVTQVPGQGAVLQGAEYSYDCWRGFLTNSQLSSYYQGHWVKPDRELEVLLQRAGSEKVDKCLVKVNLKPTPYPERGPIRHQAKVGTAPVAPPATP